MILTMAVFKATPKCKSNDKDKRERCTLTDVIRGNFKTQPPNAKVGVCVLST